MFNDDEYIEAGIDGFNCGLTINKNPYFKYKDDISKYEAWHRGWQLAYTIAELPNYNLIEN